MSSEAHSCLKFHVYVGGGSAKVADSHVLCVVSVSMTARRNESVGRIVGAGKRTVREHIAVEVIAYGVAVERDQTVCWCHTGSCYRVQRLRYPLHRS